jgi:hypothetical protein
MWIPWMWMRYKQGAVELSFDRLSWPVRDGSHESLDLPLVINGLNNRDDDVIAATDPETWRKHLQHLA